jgi:hypothetical protein
LRLVLSKGPNKVGASFSYMKTETYIFRKFVFSSYFEFRAMDKVLKPSDIIEKTPVHEMDDAYSTHGSDDKCTQF